MPAALRQFATQAHVQMLFDYEALQGLQATPITSIGARQLQQLNPGPISQALRELRSRID